ncbi:MAG: cell division protein ZapB [Nitrospirae bacterium]|nr:cell division protein ZapB [Nitrospirota bacterium]
MEKLEILETRIKSMMDLIRTLKGEKGRLEGQLKTLSGQLAKLEEENSLWENEKREIRLRIEKILGEIETLPE